MRNARTPRRLRDALSRGSWAHCAASLTALTALCGSAAAEELLPIPAQPTSAPNSGTSPPAGGGLVMDRLLTLPRGYDVGNSRKGGATRAEWRERYSEARGNLASAQTALAKTRQEMEANAADTGSWKMAPPGASVSNTESPTNFRLTQELRRGRDEVTEAERALTALDIEANIASVPEDWRH